MRIEVEGGWSDLVFHVLAHVDLGELPANLFAPAYVTWAAEQSAGSDGLGDDVRLLARLLRDSESANAVQPMAVLFADLAQAMRTADRDLADVEPNQVARSEWLPLLTSIPQPAELLRCRALLESKRHISLKPTATVDAVGPLRAALFGLVACAPRLSGCEVRLCRALTRHGRVFGARIYLGVPETRFGVSVEQVAMQGAHEATVLEVCERAGGAALSERAVERVAVVVLAQRTAAAGIEAAHAAWGAQFGVRPEHAKLHVLAPDERALARKLLSG